MAQLVCVTETETWKPIILEAIFFYKKQEYIMALNGSTGKCYKMFIFEILAMHILKSQSSQALNKISKVCKIKFYCI